MVQDLNSETLFGVADTKSDNADHLNSDNALQFKARYPLSRPPRGHDALHEKEYSIMQLADLYMLIPTVGFAQTI